MSIYAISIYLSVRMWILVRKDQEKRMRKLNIKRMKRGEVEVVRTPPDFPWQRLGDLEWIELCNILGIYPYYDQEVYVSDWCKKEGVIHFSTR